MAEEVTGGGPTDKDLNAVRPMCDKIGGSIVGEACAWNNIPII